MDQKELVEWMKNHNVVNNLKNYMHNAWTVGENYSAIEDLATKGSATVTLSIVQGNIRIAKAETHEKELENAENELDEAKKTVKAQEKTIRTLEKQVENLQKAKPAAPKKSEAVELASEY